MEEAKYDIYNIQYKIPSFNAPFFAVVSCNRGLTATQSLLEKEVEKKRKSSEGFKLQKIEPTEYKSNKEGVIFNSLSFA